MQLPVEGGGTQELTILNVSDTELILRSYVPGSQEQEFVTYTFSPKEYVEVLPCLECTFNALGIEIITELCEFDGFIIATTEGTVDTIQNTTLEAVIETFEANGANCEE